MPTPASEPSHAHPSERVNLFRSRFSALLVPDRIDRERGIIYGVSVITEGPALGHGLLVDSTTLAQMKAAAETYEGGLKVKISRGAGHMGDFAEIVGSLRAFRIAGPKLLADLHLLDNAPDRAFVLEVAEKMPDTCGLSVAFSGPAEERDGMRLARCREIYSADLVGDPAANPTGLFSAPNITTETQRTHGQNPEKDPLRGLRASVVQPALDTSANSKGDKPPSTTPSKTNLAMESDLLSQISALIDQKIAAFSAEIHKKIGTMEEEDKCMSAKLADVAKLAKDSAHEAAIGAVKEFSKTLGQPAGAAAAPSAPPAAPAPAKKFEDLVKEHPEYTKSKTSAQRAVMLSAPAAYADYRARCEKGEITLF